MIQPPEGLVPPASALSLQQGTHYPLHRCSASQRSRGCTLASSVSSLASSCSDYRFFASLGLWNVFTPQLPTSDTQCSTPTINDRHRLSHTDSSTEFGSWWPLLFAATAGCLLCDWLTRHHGGEVNHQVSQANLRGLRPLLWQEPFCLCGKLPQIN